MSARNPLISVCVPTHEIPEREVFLERLSRSLARQTYQNFELVVTQEGKMAANSNAAIKKAKGDIVKILYMDDYLFDENALQHIADYAGTGWMVSGCVHDDGQRVFNAHYPLWNEEVPKGVNTIGSPSVLAFANEDPLLFDERMSWVLDCELYGRLFKRYGPPTVINSLDVAIGVGSHQTTFKLSDEEKAYEQTLL